MSAVVPYASPRAIEELTEASGAGVEIALHQEGPAIAHEIQRGSDWA